MDDFVFFDKWGGILTVVTLIICATIFFNDTGDLIASIFAAVMAAGLFWMTYIILKWLILARY